MASHRPCDETQHRRVRDFVPRSPYGQLRFAVVAEQQAGNKPEATITAAKIALIGTIVAAIIGATATITVALTQRQNSLPAPATVTHTFPAATPGFAPKKVFDESALERDQGVKKILISSYGLPTDQIRSVDCPANQEVKAGNKFTCTIQLSGDNAGKTSSTSSSATTAASTRSTHRKTSSETESRTEVPAIAARRCTGSNP